MLYGCIWLELNANGMGLICAKSRSSASSNSSELSGAVGWRRLIGEASVLAPFDFRREEAPGYGVARRLPALGIWGARCRCHGESHFKFTPP